MAVAMGCDVFQMDRLEKMVLPVLNRAQNGDRKAMYWMAN